MGLGGDLLWTPALHALHERNGNRVLLCDRPLLSDILAGVRYNRGSKRHLSPVFKNNPFVGFPDCCSKGSVSRLLDRVGELVIGFNRLKNNIENSCYTSSRNSNFQSLYLDLPQHSYVDRIEKQRYVWKKRGHIIDILAESVGLTGVPHECEMYFSEDEERQARELVASVNSLNYITIEPSTNVEFFGELRSWPFERWQEVVNHVRTVHPDVAVVQVGVAGSRIVNGCVNMCGKTDFRQAAQLIRHSKLFVGTEGGLMHCANAVKTAALVLWGGLTQPDFAAYPEKHKVLHHQVKCAPCGLLGNCPHSHECMLSISTDEVIAELDKQLRQLVPA